MDKDLKKALAIIRELLDELPWHERHDKVADKAEAFVQKMDEKHKTPA